MRHCALHLHPSLAPYYPPYHPKSNHQTTSQRATDRTQGDARDTAPVGHLACILRDADAAILMTMYPFSRWPPRFFPQAVVVLLCHHLLFLPLRSDAAMMVAAASDLHQRIFVHAPPTHTHARNLHLCS